MSSRNFENRQINTRANAVSTNRESFLHDVRTHQLNQLATFRSPTFRNASPGLYGGIARQAANFPTRYLPMRSYGAFPSYNRLGGYAPYGNRNNGYGRFNGGYGGRGGFSYSYNYAYTYGARAPNVQARPLAEIMAEREREVDKQISREQRNYYLRPASVSVGAALDGIGDPLQNYMDFAERANIRAGRAGEMQNPKNRAAMAATFLRPTDNQVRARSYINYQIGTGSPNAIFYRGEKVYDPQELRYDPKKAEFARMAEWYTDIQNKIGVIQREYPGKLEATAALANSNIVEQIQLIDPRAGLDRELYKMLSEKWYAVARDLARQGILDKQTGGVVLRGAPRTAAGRPLPSVRGNSYEQFTKPNGLNPSASAQPAPLAQSRSASAPTEQPRTPSRPFETVEIEPGLLTAEYPVTAKVGLDVTIPKELVTVSATPKGSPSYGVISYQFDSATGQYDFRSNAEGNYARRAKVTFSFIQDPKLAPGFGKVRLTFTKPGRYIVDDQPVVVGTEVQKWKDEQADRDTGINQIGASQSLSFAQVPEDLNIVIQKDDGTGQHRMHVSPAQLPTGKLTHFYHGLSILKKNDKTFIISFFEPGQFRIISPGTGSGPFPYGEEKSFDVKRGAAPER